jgi:myo-inositol 2-dehydrogenase/D-chiro-inositol 1-dehydrogenase
MLNIGIVGMGRIGRVHAEGVTKYVPGARVAATADPSPSPESATLSEDLGLPRILEDYHDILADPAVDAVLICSPTDTHSAVSLEALEAGKHVFCEKPIDTDTGRIRAVIDRVRATGLTFQVGFNRRFDHNFMALRRAVLEGKVGGVHMVKVTSRDPAPPPIEFVRHSGGMFLDMTIHDLDMVRYLSGSDIEEIYVNAAVLVDREIGKAGDVDTAILSMKLSSGALAVIDNSRRAAYGYDQRAEVFGSLGSAATGHDTASTLVLSTDAGITAEKPLHFFLERYMQSFAEELRQFVNAIKTGAPAPVTAEDGLKPVLAAIAAKKSLDEGRPVKLSEIE